MYLFLFLVALPGQLLFGVTTMTMSAVVTTYVFGLVYFGLTGTYYFFDSYIPIAVFLGMHLLFTDPSTAPRTELGRMIFGALYGLSTIVLYDLLGRAGLPTFYDKLLQVPLLNLTIQRIDRAVRGTWLRRFDPSAIGRSLAPRRRNLAYVTLWATVFAAISAAQGVGDRHRGQWIPFWRQACAAERSGACAYLAQLYSTLCDAGSHGRAASSASCGRAGGSMGARRAVAACRGAADPVAREQGADQRSNADTFVRSRLRAGVVAAYCEMAAALRGKISAGEP